MILLINDINDTSDLQCILFILCRSMLNTMIPVLYFEGWRIVAAGSYLLKADDYKAAWDLISFLISNFFFNIMQRFSSCIHCTYLYGSRSSLESANNVIHNKPFCGRINQECPKVYKESYRWSPRVVNASASYCEDRKWAHPESRRSSNLCKQQTDTMRTKVGHANQWVWVTNGQP